MSANGWALAFILLVISPVIVAGFALLVRAVTRLYVRRVVERELEEQRRQMRDYTPSVEESLQRLVTTFEMYGNLHQQLSNIAVDLASLARTQDTASVLAMERLQMERERRDEEKQREWAGQ